MKVMNARRRLGELSSWGCNWKEAVDSIVKAMESCMELLSTSPAVNLPGISNELTLKLHIQLESALHDNDPATALPTSTDKVETIKLSMSREWSPGRGWSGWAADKGQVEAVLALWMFHLHIISKKKPTGSVRLLHHTYEDTYKRWIQRKIQPMEIDLSNSCPSNLLILGIPTAYMEPRIHQNPPPARFLGLTSESPLEKICGHIILSAVIRAISQDPSMSLEGTTQVRGGGNSLNSNVSSGWRNTVLTDLANTIERTGLATVEEAFICIIPPLEKAGKLPSNLTSTSEVYLDMANEITTWLQGGRISEAEHLFLWLLDTVESAAERLEAKGKWEAACGEYFLFCTVMDSMTTNAKTYITQAEDLTANFCERFLLSLYLTNTCGSQERMIEKIRETFTAILDTKSTNQDIWDKRLENWSRGLKGLDLGELGRIIDKTDIDSQGKTTLIRASTDKHTAVVSYLLRKDIMNKSSQTALADRSGKTAIHYASMHGHTSVLHILLRHIKSPTELEIKDQKNHTALEYAIRARSTLSLALLIFYGAEYQLMDHRVAVRDCNDFVLSILFNMGAGINVNANPDMGQSPLLNLALVKGEDSIPTVRLLLARGADVNRVDTDGYTPLHLAAKSGSRELCQLLLDSGADANPRDKQGATPLHMVKTGSLSQVLLDGGADFNAVDEDGNTPVHLAARWDYRNVVQSLLERGADAKPRNKQGATPLHLAGGRWRSYLVPVLLDGGADLNAANEDGDTPLHLAAMKEDQDVVQLLLAKGADANTRNKRGATPLHMVGSGSLVQVLLDRGADFKAVNEDDDTPLHLAAMRGSGDVVQSLLERGADAHPHNKQGVTPLQIARSKFFDGVVRILEEKVEAETDSPVR